jgi:hypothetical protein
VVGIGGFKQGGEKSGVVLLISAMAIITDCGTNRLWKSTGEFAGDLVFRRGSAHGD